MIVHKNPYFSVNLKDDYYSINFPLEQVITLTTVNDEYFLFVKVKRNLLNDSTIEFPSGSVNKNETIEHGALRELFEETGIKVRFPNRLIKYPSLSSIPSRLSQKLNVFQINLTMDEYNKRQRHDDEIDEIFIETFSNAIKLVETGEIYVTGTISLMFSYLELIKRKE